MKIIIMLIVLSIVVSGLIAFGVMIKKAPKIDPMDEL